MLDWTLMDASLVGALMVIFSLVVGGIYCLVNYIVEEIKFRRELKIIRPRKEYFDYEKALYEYVMKD